MTRYWWSERVGPGFSHSYEVELLYEERTPFQHMHLFYTPLWGRALALDGVIQLTEQDEFIYHEMMVHVPMLGMSRPPESVLIIGGADGGALREVQKYSSVKRIVQVELDRAVLDACRKYLPGICGDWNDPRVELVIGDGAQYMKDAAKRGDVFDCIILDSTDPVGPSLVLFDHPFHKDVASCLAPDGVVTRQAGLPLTMPDVAPFVVRRFQDHFPGVWTYRAPVPTYGDEMAFVGASKDGRPFSVPREDYRGRYYNAGCHKGAFAIPSWWEDLIKNYKDTGEVPIMPL